MVSPSRAILIAGALLLPLGAGLGALLLGMDANWDFRNYHWYNGWAVLAGRLGRDMVVAQVPSWYAPTLDVPLYLLGTALSARGAAFVLGAVAGLNGVLVMLIAFATLRGAPVVRALVALALGAAGLGGACAISELGTAFNDYVLMLGFLAALLVLVRGAPRLVAAPLRPALGCAALAGLLIGLTVGLKLTAAIFAVGLGCAALALPAGPVRRLLVAGTLTLAAVLAFALSAGPWMAYLWQATGNPLFPFFNHVFQSPLMPPVSFRDEHFVPYGQPLAWLLFPFWMLWDPYRTMEVPFFDLRLGLALMALPLGLLALAWRRWRGTVDMAPEAVLAAAPLQARVLLVTGFAAYVAWVLFFCIYRYALALEMLAPLFVVVALCLLPGSSRLRLGLAVALVLAAVVTVEPGNWGRKPWTQKWVEVTVPPMPDAEHAMVLMAGYEPTSFVVPALPTAPRYIRIHSNFTGPNVNGLGQPGFGINDRMREVVEAHPGPFYVLFQLAKDTRPEEALATFGLAFNRVACVHMPTSVEDDPIVLCPVKRTPGWTGVTPDAGG